KEILNLYKQVYEELYAVPAIIGRKSEKEKFAGAEYTTSVETFVPSGKAVQAATSHFLGQNFSKAFDISFLDKEGQKRFVYQNSWGMSTRTIGVMIMMHGDDKGLIIPPRVAPLHVMIVPILFEKTKDKVITAAKKLYKDLQGDEFTVEIDLREGYTSGWKFNEWELKGVPIRIEIGPKDIEKKQAVLVRRDTGEKEVVKINKVRKRIPKLLEEIQENLFNQAKKFLKNNTKKADNWLDFEKAVKEKKLVYAPWCNATKCEEKIKEKTGAKVLNIPFKHVRPKGKCIFCNNPAKVMAYFAKSY
ncbi:proline--tRNA ligase, partial [Candidatus Woesearchaeota archaeon]